MIKAGDMPFHLRELLDDRLRHADRSSGGFLAGDVVQALRPTLEEARTTAYFRERALQLAEERLGSRKNVRTKELAWEVVGLIGERLEGAQVPGDGYYPADVPWALQKPSFEELQQVAHEASDPQLSKWQRKTR